VALNLGKLYLLISGKSEPLKKELDKAHGMVTKKATAMQRTISNSFRLAFSLPGLLVGGGIGYLFKDAIKTASDLEEVTGKFNVVFRDQIQLAESWAQTLVDSYGLSNIEAKKFLSSIQDLLKPMGVASDEAAKLSNEVVKLAVDLGSFNNVRTEDVIRDIESALVGNFETMKKYGVVLNVARIRQEAFNQGLIKGTEKLTAAERAVIAYNLIVQGSADAIGDWHRTQNSLANQMKQLRSNIINFKGSIGDALLPKVNEAITGMNEWVKANKSFLIQDLPGYIIKIGSSIERTVEVLGKINNVLPEGTTGSVGTGLIAYKLFGKGSVGAKAGVIAAALYYIAVNLDKFKKSFKGVSDIINKSFLFRPKEMVEGYNQLTELTNKYLLGLSQIEEKSNAILQIEKQRFSQAKTLAKDRPDFYTGGFFGGDPESYYEAIRAAAEKAEAARLKALKKEQEAYVGMLPTLKTYRDSWEVKGERTFTDEQIDKINRLKTEYIDALPTIRTFRDSWEVKDERTFTDEQIDKIKEMNKAYNDTYEDILKSTEALTSQMSNAFTDFVMTGKLSFKDLAQSILRDLVSIQSNRIFTNIFSGLPKLLGFGAAATGGEADVKGQHGAYLGEGVVGFGRSSGKSYEFHPNEYVMPSDKMAGRAPNVEVNVINNLGVEANVQQTTSQMDPNRVITEIILNEKMSSRSFRRGLRG